jgi:adenosine kinase
MGKAQLVISGSIAIDRIMNFSNRYKDLVKPEKIHILSISVFLDKLKDTQGGVAANICYSLALLGETPIILGSIGKDGADYMKRLSSIGVDISHLHHSSLPTASFNVMTDMDDNQVGGFFPGAMFDSSSLSFKKWKNKNVIVTIAPHDPKAMKRQVKECQDYSLRLFYDIGQQVSNTPPEDILDGVSAAELLIVNDFEFAVICEKIGKSPEAIKKTVPVVVITKGREGSIIDGRNVDKTIIIPSAKPKVIADPTGAGDAFRAGFLYGYSKGWDLELCGKLGSTVSVYAVEKHGTQEHIFTTTELEKRFEENFRQNLSLVETK